MAGKSRSKTLPPTRAAREACDRLVAYAQELRDKERLEKGELTCGIKADTAAHLVYAQYNRRRTA